MTVSDNFNVNFNNNLKLRSSLIAIMQNFYALEFCNNRSEFIIMIADLYIAQLLFFRYS